MNEPMQVELPESLREFVEDEAQSAGLPAPGDYVRLLIEEAQRKKAVAFLEGLADEAVQSGPATPWTRDDVEEIKRAVRAKRGPNGGTKA